MKKFQIGYFFLFLIFVSCSNKETEQQTNNSNLFVEIHKKEFKFADLESFELNTNPNFEGLSEVKDENLRNFISENISYTETEMYYFSIENRVDGFQNFTVTTNQKVNEENHQIVCYIVMNKENKPISIEVIAERNNSLYTYGKWLNRNTYQFMEDNFNNQIFETEKLKINANGGFEYE